MIQRLLIAGVATLLALPAHASDYLRSFLPDVFIFKDGTVTIEVELKAQCASVNPLREGPCLDVPGGGRIFLPIGRIPVPPAGGNPFSLGAIIFEDFGPETNGTLSGLIGFGPQDVGPLFELPLVFSFGSVTFGREFSTVFSYGGSTWQTRTAGIGEPGQFRLEEIPTSENGSDKEGTDLFAIYLPFNVEPVNRVPEPATAALMLAGLAGLARFRRRG